MDDLRAVDLVECSATELARLVRDRQASPVEVVDAYLERIDRVNPGLNAIVTLRTEQARAEAKRLELAFDADHPLPLAGVPFTVKDLIATAGVRTTAGTPFLSTFIPEVDATAVARLHTAGAILLGKTNCPEFGMFPYTRNSLFGETRNPLGPVTPGGSSGGEAAAIAARCSPLGFGTDFGGSVRWPAHCTGVFALRPTAGRVPGTGQLPAPSLNEPLIPNEVTLQGRVQVVGPLARSVDDLEVALKVASGTDGLDPFAVPAPLTSSRDSAVSRVAIWEGPADPPVRDDVRGMVRDAARALDKRGVTVTDEQPSMLERAVSLYTEIRDLDRLQDVRRLVRGCEDEVGEDVRAAIAVAEEAERRQPHPDSAVLWDERDRLRASFLAFLDRQPVLLMAVATVPPYDLAGTPPSVGGRDQSMWDVLAPSRLISLFGVPAATVPFGTSAGGWPIGVQVVGRPFREDEVLAVARWLSEEVGG
jgi:Asp-tRNA(Asn)/Glu-tRNA(Gln) amidotransferase A subunit family amidase